MSTPCANCVERYEACHDFCKDYKDWKKERTEYVEKHLKYDKSLVSQRSNSKKMPYMNFGGFR